MLLLEHGSYFAQDSIEMFHDLLLPYLYRFSDLALVGLVSMKPLLSTDMVQRFYREIPLLFTPLIETREPLLESPVSRPVRAFQPRPAPENYFRFASVESFANGFDLAQKVIFPVASRLDLCSESVASVITLLVKAAAGDLDLLMPWLDTFRPLFEERTNSRYFFDYLGLCVRCWIEIGSRQ